MTLRKNHTRRRTGRVGKVVESTRFKNEEGSCYLLVVPCANPSDRQHKRGRRFITMFLFSVASVTDALRTRKVHVMLSLCLINIVSRAHT